MNKDFDFTKLRKLRRHFDITTDDVSRETGVSIGYINRIERGYVSNIKNIHKNLKLQTYIEGLEIKFKSEFRKI